MTERLERAFAGRAAELNAAARDVLLVAAVDSADDLTEVLAAASVLAGRTLGVEAVDEAAARGLLATDGARVTFRHPLVRSAAVAAESLGRRQAAHAAVAAVLGDEPFRRVWHRAQSIVGPDDAIADELEEGHRTSLARGSVGSAIWALERSAQLTSAPERRGRRLLVAAEHAFGLGDAAAVDRLVTAAERLPLAELERVRIPWLRELFHDGVPGDAARVLELCEGASLASAAQDVDLALNLLLGAALRCWWADAGREARERVLDVAESLTGARDPRYVAVLAVAQPVAGGTAVIAMLAAVTLERVADADALRLYGMAAHAVGDQPRAADFLDRAETRLRDQGRLGLLSHVLAMQIQVRMELGDWRRAAEAADEGRRLAEDTGQPTWDTGSLVGHAQLAARRGDTERALALAMQAEDAAQHRKLNDFLACVQLARGFAWCSAGRHDNAFVALRRLFDPDDPAFHLRERFGGIIPLAEAAVRVGRVDEARTVVAEMERVAELTPSPLLRVQLSYARAVLSDELDAEAHFRAALDQDLVRWPWVRARIELAYGSWLRRRHRAAESRHFLRTAATTLELIGAATSAEQARAELRAAGERAAEATGGSGGLDVLSAQELQIARLAAQGLSNREIGERLYLSPRTIGSHLYRIFPKLDITSRGQLAARVSGGVTTHRGGRRQPRPTARPRSAMRTRRRRSQPFHAVAAAAGGGAPAKGVVRWGRPACWTPSRSRPESRAVAVEASTASYVTTVVVGIIITMVVGQLLLRVGYDFLVEVYEDRTLATSLNYLLVTLFHLIALGLVGIVSTANPIGLNGIQLIITRIGFILLILGGVYGLTVLALTTARNRRRRDTFEDSIIARDERKRGP